MPSTDILAGLALAVSVFSIWLTFYLYRHKDRSLESDQIRKRKVSIIDDLIGSRYVLDANYPASTEEVQVFNRSIGLLGVYFSDDRRVSDAYDAFKTSKTDDNLLRLLK